MDADELCEQFGDPRDAHAVTGELRNGVRQAELVHTTGYTREHLCRIAREAGMGGIKQ